MGGTPGGGGGGGGGGGVGRRAVHRAQHAVGVLEVDDGARDVGGVVAGAVPDAVVGGDVGPGSPLDGDAVGFEVVLAVVGKRAPVDRVLRVQGAFAVRRVGRS